MEKINEYLKRIREGEDFISAEVLEAVPYENRQPNTWVEIRHPEFTSLCPRTGLPDYGTITINYLPQQHIVELKSLKYYFLQFRNTGIFYEKLTPLILNHLVEVSRPLEMIVEAEFTSRGGLAAKIKSTYKKE
jgi:7-cyano-7-deazaguanine reductase